MKFRSASCGQTPELIPWRHKAGLSLKQVLTSTVTIWLKRETGLLFFLRLPPLAFHVVETTFRQIRIPSRNRASTSVRVRFVVEMNRRRREQACFVAKSRRV
jgi:hypothetical protein